MGSSVSPIVANLYMECFEGKALTSAANPPQVWYRFVDDTWVIQQQSSKQEFLEHINEVAPAIKFTVEGTQGNGAIPFLDTLVTLQTDGFLSITVYQNPTHTYEYLQWDSHHSLSAKYSVIGTLTHRAKTVCTNPEPLDKEVKHLREAMGKCKYPTWAINKVQSKVLNNNQGENGNTNNNQAQPSNDQESGSRNTTTTRSNQNYTGQVVIPYTQGQPKALKTYVVSMVSKYSSRATQQ